MQQILISIFEAAIEEVNHLYTAKSLNGSEYEAVMAADRIYKAMGLAFRDAGITADDLAKIIFANPISREHFRWIFEWKGSNMVAWGDKRNGDNY